MTATPSLPANVAGFTPIPITYSANATHILYARAHRSNAQTKYHAKGKGKEVAFPEGRTLFLVNVPPDATEREITLLFKQSGTVERVVFDGDEDVEQMLEQEQELEDSGDEGVDAAEEEEMEDDDSDAGGHPRKKRKIAKDKARPAAPPVIPLPPRTTRILRRTGRTAHIIFLDASSVSRALTVPSKPKSWPVDASAPRRERPCGFLDTVI
ncbi:hypothetical protein NM688_g3276 [Phlebia brevispora]|uniref:Uncharacterized protein n=1 Tax=Phlebia brevispora TaxID=194682 RepID=A0ACC1T6A2_9APHY|nr:hypothetical protein NM688_g3276 [Phlebia brevispora]